MVVRLVRAGVGALLLLIAVPLALAGGGLLLAMEHRAGDDTFAARLERVRADGTAIVVPDVDALLRADAPFARGGQTTLSLSAVGSGGPLFIGLAPTADVRRYLGGQAHARLTHVRLARGPLPVELAAVPADRAASQAPANAATGQNPADGSQPGQNPADLAAAANEAANQAQNQAQNQAGAGQPGEDPAAGQGGDPDGQGATNPGADGRGAGQRGPAAERFWIARSEQRAGEARLTWSSSALRGKHLALVVMRADGGAGIDAAITARLAPAWLGPTTGGLLMLGGALFFLALITLAWPPARPATATGPAADPLPIPAQATPDEQPRSGEPEADATPGEEPENAAAPDEARKAEAQPEAVAAPEADPDPETGTATGAAVTAAPVAMKPAAESAAATTPGDMKPEAGAVTAAPGAMKLETGAAASGLSAMKPETGAAASGPGAMKAEAAAESGPAGIEAERKGAHERVMATLADVLKAADAEVPPPARPVLRECELDRPAPEDAGLEIDLPPLPAMPNIELQFTWAPLEAAGESDAKAEKPAEPAALQ